MAESQRPKQLHELLSRSVVDIYVGPKNTQWTLHEKLLCYHSPFFRKIFYAKGSKVTTYGLPDEEDVTFKALVGWLYSSHLPIPNNEDDLGLHFDLYLLAEKLQIPALIQDILLQVREYYRDTDSYPSLRRVQYIYANTEDGSPMRHMLVHSVARMLVLDKEIAKHWDKALRKNGQLAVDIIRSIQEWDVPGEYVPDARDEPADAEELMEEEVQETVVKPDVTSAKKHDANGVEAGEEQQETDGDEGQYSGDDTVVESPIETKAPKINDPKIKNKGTDNAVNGLDKMTLQDEMPNRIALEDYGSLH